MSHDDVISKIWYHFRTSGAVISLHAKFEPDQRYIKVMFLNDLKMTHDDVINKIWYRIRTPDAVISLHSQLRGFYRQNGLFELLISLGIDIGSDWNILIS